MRGDRWGERARCTRRTHRLAEEKIVRAGLTRKRCGAAKRAVVPHWAYFLSRAHGARWTEEASGAEAGAVTVRQPDRGTVGASRASSRCVTIRAVAAFGTDPTHQLVNHGIVRIRDNEVAISVLSNRVNVPESGCWEIADVPPDIVVFSCDKLHVAVVGGVVHESTINLPVVR